MMEQQAAHRLARGVHVRPPHVAAACSARWPASAPAAGHEDVLAAVGAEGPRVNVVVVGAGINGIGAARRLSGEGESVVVLERLPEVGGVWTGFANETSRSQNHEPAYRLGPTPGEEDCKSCSRSTLFARLLS